MLRISKLTDYGTVVLAELARDEQAFVSSAEIAASTGLGLPTVSKLLKMLARAGLVTSIRGPRGGYRLAPDYWEFWQGRPNRLHDRIRSRLGHLVEHAGAVEVRVQSGTVTLSGEVSDAESESLPRAIGRMPGVASVESALTVRKQAPAEEQEQASGQAQDVRQGPGATSGQSANPAASPSL